MVLIVFVFVCLWDKMIFITLVFVPKMFLIVFVSVCLPNKMTKLCLSLTKWPSLCMSLYLGETKWSGLCLSVVKAEDFSPPLVCPPLQSCINLQPLTRDVITTAWRQLGNLNPTQTQIVLSDLVEMKCCSIEISSNHVSHFFSWLTSCFTSNSSSWSEFLFSLSEKLYTITTADVRKSSIEICHKSVLETMKDVHSYRSANSLCILMFIKFKILDSRPFPGSKICIFFKETSFLRIRLRAPPGHYCHALFFSLFPYFFLLFFAPPSYFSFPLFNSPSFFVLV